MRQRTLNANQFDDARHIPRDIDSLDFQTAFHFDKINKIFSVASVALLPPTLLASIYGMNFQHMPEVSRTRGCPFALLLMVASALVPMWYFRKRGWLK